VSCRDLTIHWACLCRTWAGMASTFCSRGLQVLSGPDGRHVLLRALFPRAAHSREPGLGARDFGVQGASSLAPSARAMCRPCSSTPRRAAQRGWTCFRRFLGADRSPAAEEVEATSVRHAAGPHDAKCLAKRVIACLDVRANDQGDLVVTKGDQYDVREDGDSREVRNLGKPVELAGRYFLDGADEVAFLNITGFRDFPLGDLPMLEVMKRASERSLCAPDSRGGIRDFKDKEGRRVQQPGGRGGVLPVRSRQGVHRQRGCVCSGGVLQVSAGRRPGRQGLRPYPMFMGTR